LPNQSLFKIYPPVKVNDINNITSVISYKHPDSIVSLQYKNNPNEIVATNKSSMMMSYKNCNHVVFSMNRLYNINSDKNKDTLPYVSSVNQNSFQISSGGNGSKLATPF
jgi:hypothetical protein